MSGYSVDFQKVVQDLQRRGVNKETKKKNHLFEEVNNRNWAALTMSCVVPIFLASSLRSMVLR